MNISTQTMPVSVLFVKIFKTTSGNNNAYNERLSIYNKMIKKHNLSVWQSLPHSEKLKRSKGLLTEMIERDSRIESNNESIFMKYNPYVDSGFDILQPDMSQGETDRTFTFDEKTTHLLDLGIAGSMFTLYPERDFYKKINWEITNERSREYHANNGAVANSNVRVVPYGGVFSQIIFNQEKHLMNTIISDIEQHNPESGDIKNPIIVDDSKCNAVPQPFKLHPRSSIYKKKFRMANSTGIIDSGYRGELRVAIDVLEEAAGCPNSIRNCMGSSETRTIHGNKRYFQICKPDLTPFYVCKVEELPNTERGADGFGSTGM